MKIQMSDTTKDSTNGAGLNLAVGGMSHLFTFDTVLLCREGEGNEGGRAELERRALHDVEVVTCTDFELDVFEAKGVFCVASGVRIFTGP